MSPKPRHQVTDGPDQSKRSAKEPAAPRSGSPSSAATSPAASAWRPAQTQPFAPGLYLVATPIGNLRDITLRALDTLAGADFVVCEDTRVTGKLLAHYQISTPMRSYNDHNAARQRPGILAALADGKRIALVSDAGSPLISDPGYKLVEAVVVAGHPVEAVPGATAAIAGLQLSGLPSDRFLFAGFLAPKAGRRRSQLEALETIDATLIFYESGRRLGETLDALLAVFGNRPAAVARELTKLHEEVQRGTLSELADRYRTPPKGEIVLLVGGYEPPEMEAADIDAQILAALDAGSSTKEAAATVAAATGRKRRDLYQRALALAADAGTR